MNAKADDTDSEPIRETAHVDGFEAAAVFEFANWIVAARERAEALLDEALGETFSASDPLAITPRKRRSK